MYPSYYQTQPMTEDMHQALNPFAFSAKEELKGLSKVSKVGNLLVELEERKMPCQLNQVFDVLAETNAKLAAAGKSTEKLDITELLNSDDASVLMPRIIYGALREASEPIMVFKQFFQPVRLVAGNMLIFPSTSAMVAADIGENQPFPQSTVDFALHKSLEIRVGKYGLSYAVTDEAIEDSLWDVIGILTRQAGRAMARHEEQKRSNAFQTHAWTRFDGDKAIQGSSTEDTPTGMGWNPSVHPGSAPASSNLSKNGTLATMDWIEMIATLMMHNFTPTDVIMHPLYWPWYSKTMFVGGLGNVPLRWNPRSIPMGEQAIGAAIPFAINPILSPRVYFNRMKKVGDVYVIDRSEVGVELIKDEIGTEEWREPNREVRNIKIRGRKGYGILNKGRSIIRAANIRADISYDPSVQFFHMV